MESLITTIHIIACVSLVLLVLLQSGKEDMGVIFGGGGSSMFGSSGAGNLLSKLTAVAATVFFITSLSFTYMSTNKLNTERQSIILDAPTSTAPATSASEAPASTSPAAR